MMECMKFLVKQIKYPIEALVNKIQGKPVCVYFVFPVTFHVN